jgi:cob(I)alamin adenosyltransferase
MRPAIPLCLDGPPSEAGPEGTGAEGCRAAVREVWEYSCEQLLAGSVDLMVLDELGLAVELGWLEAHEVSDALERRSAHLDVILTGPAMPAALMAMADQITELRRGL